MKETVPNTIEEDLRDGDEGFLKMKTNRSTTRRGSLPTTMQVRADSKGDLLKRSLVGPREIYTSK